MPESGTLIRPEVQPSEQPAQSSADQTEATDQQRFDAVVDRDSKIVLSILAGVAILAALIMFTVALVLSSGARNTHNTVTRTVSAAVTSPAKAIPAPLTSLSVEGSSKRGPDGKMHDAFSKSDFVAKVGQPTRLRIDNKDDVAHSITAPQTGVSIVVMPGLHTYTMTATTAGRFEWVCIIPCDSGAAGWAMTHPGYMAGYITVT